MIEYTQEQKVQMADLILKGISQGNEREILRGLESMGYKPPAQVQKEAAEYDRRIAAGENPAEAAYNASLAHEQQLQAERAQFEEQQRQIALQRQQQGANFNNPQHTAFIDDLKKQKAEIEKMRAELAKEKTSLREEVAKVETAVMADKFNTSLTNEVSKMRADYPALKGLKDAQLIQMVKDAKQDQYQQTQEIVSTKEILQAINNEWAAQINSHIEDKTKHLKIFKDEDDEGQVVKDDKGNVLGKLNDEGVLVKTLTKDDTAGDKVEAKVDPNKKMFQHTNIDKTRDDGTIVVDTDDIDPDRLIRAANEARDQGPSQDSEGTSKVEAILQKAYERGDDDGSQATETTSSASA